MIYLYINYDVPQIMTTLEWLKQHTTEVVGEPQKDLLAALFSTSRKPFPYQIKEAAFFQNLRGKDGTIDVFDSEAGYVLEPHIWLCTFQKHVDAEAAEYDTIQSQNNIDGPVYQVILRKHGDPSIFTLRENKKQIFINDIVAHKYFKWLKKKYYYIKSYPADFDESDSMFKVVD